jgi:hypothetical protein
MPVAATDRRSPFCTHPQHTRRDPPAFDESIHLAFARCLSSRAPPPAVARKSATAVWIGDTGLGVSRQRRLGAGPACIHTSFPILSSRFRCALEYFFVLPVSFPYPCLPLDTPHHKTPPPSSEPPHAAHGGTRTTADRLRISLPPTLHPSICPRPDRTNHRPTHARSRPSHCPNNLPTNHHIPSQPANYRPLPFPASPTALRVSTVVHLRPRTAGGTVISSSTAGAPARCFAPWLACFQSKVVDRAPPSTLGPAWSCFAIPSTFEPRESEQCRSSTTRPIPSPALSHCSGFSSQTRSILASRASTRDRRREGEASG